MFYILALGLLILTNFILLQNKILCHNNIIYDHKKIGKQNVPLSGGVYFITVVSIYLFFFDTNGINLNILVPLSLFFILGVSIDIGYEINPKIRLLTQFLIILFLTYGGDFLVDRTNLVILDKILEIKAINIFFTSFCIIILINGLNFIDGINCNAVGFILLSIITIFAVLLKIEKLPFSLNELFLIFAILIFYLFNLFEKNFLGESGNYVIGFFISILLIKIVNDDKVISPIFAVSIFWYPAFENLFSILRKFFFNKTSAFSADTLHLHTLLFNFLKNKNLKYSNSLSGVLINLSLIPNFLISYNNFYNSKILIINVLLYLILYMLIYYKLKKYQEIR